MGIARSDRSNPRNSPLSAPIRIEPWKPTSRIALASASFAAQPPKELPCQEHATGSIARVWHGKVPNAKADEYQQYIGAAIQKFTSLPGNQGYVLLKDKSAEHTDFTVISYWDGKKSIEAYAGKDITLTHFLPRDKDYLIDPEKTVKNYEIAQQACAR